MGKYDQLKGKLPAFQQEASFQQEVDEAKKRHQSHDASELITIFSAERQNKKNCETEIAAVNIELEALSQLLVENFEASGLSSMKLQTGETCYQQVEPYSSVQDQTSLLAFIKKSKQQNLLTLQWQVMNAMNKDRLVAGKPPLPGTAVFLKTSVRLKGSTVLSEE